MYIYHSSFRIIIIIIIIIINISNHFIRSIG